jgi:hypothetical protein
LFGSLAKESTARPVILIIIIILLVLLLGGGAYYGPRAGWGGPHYGGGCSV